MVLYRFLLMLPLILITILCSNLESISQTNRKFEILQLVEKSVLSENSTLHFNSPLYRYHEQYLIDSNSRIKLLDGTYSKVNEENVRSHLEYKIYSTKKTGQYYTIDTMEQFFAFQFSVFDLGFGILNSVDSKTKIAVVNGRKFNVREGFCLASSAKDQGFHFPGGPTLGKYLMFSVNIQRDSSLNIEFYESINDSLLNNQIGSITLKKGSLVTINNKNIYITDYSVLLDDKGNKLQIQDFKVSSNTNIEYFYHEFSKKYIALKMKRLKN